jgi:hypothetical protein
MKKIIYLACILLSSCAQIIAPTGGEADKTPPELVSSYPENKTKNYKGKEFKLSFNELIDASKLNSELVIVPDPGQPYEVKVKNKEVIIKFDKELAENTTYTLNFRNGITDLTEKNPAKNLKLVISTGSEIDSLQVSGNIKDLFTKEEKLDVTVGLYPYDTLDFGKKKPLYFIKTDSSGNYTFENIKSDKYFLLAFTDKNNNLRFDQKEEQVGFLPDSIHVNQNINLSSIEIYRANHTKNKIKRTIVRENEMVLQLEKPVLRASIIFENKEDSLKTSMFAKGPEIKFFRLDKEIQDSIKAKIVLQDSLLISDTLQQKIYFKQESNRKKKIGTISLLSSIKNQQEVTTDMKYEFSVDQPLKRLDLEKIQVKADTNEIAVNNIYLINNQHFTIEIPKVNAKDIEIHIPSNILENYQGDTNTVVVLKNPLLKDDQLGLVEGEVQDKERPKIALLQDENRTKIIRQVNFTDRFIFDKIVPGSYQITIVFDDNKNGIWDPGNLELRKLPEEVLSTKEPIRIRANYEFRNLKIE